jgi:hypothetical protein
MHWSLLVLVVLVLCACPATVEVSDHPAFGPASSAIQLVVGAEDGGDPDPRAGAGVLLYGGESGLCAELQEGLPEAHRAWNRLQDGLATRPDDAGVCALWDVFWDEFEGAMDGVLGRGSRLGVIQLLLSLNPNEAIWREFQDGSWPVDRSFEEQLIWARSRVEWIDVDLFEASRANYDCNLEPVRSAPFGAFPAARNRLTLAGAELELTAAEGAWTAEVEGALMVDEDGAGRGTLSLSAQFTRCDVAVPRPGEGMPDLF